MPLVKCETCKDRLDSHFSVIINKKTYCRACAMKELHRLEQQLIEMLKVSENGNNKVH